MSFELSFVKKIIKPQVKSGKRRNAKELIASVGGQGERADL